ncbi:MAG: hypothetical protein ACOVKO_10095 [Elstera sp.]
MQVRIADYPELRKLCWNRPPEAVLDGADALALYERNWRHVDPEALEANERALIQSLATRYGGGVLNV